MAKETQASTDYAKYAAMAETPSQSERRKFNYIAVSGAVEMEVVDEKEGTTKRKPAKAIKLFTAEEKNPDGTLKSEELDLPLTIIPIKYRTVMEQRAGSKGEILVLKSSEFNGRQDDVVTITRFSPDGKAVSTTAPMKVADARKHFLSAEQKPVLKDKVHLYSLVNGELVRFVIKGTGLWEKEDDLSKGKTEASRAKHQFLSAYLQQFAATDPYFLYELVVDACYRDHGSIQYYRPTFTKGKRIDGATEKIVLAHLEDLHAFFTERDAAVKAYVPSTTAVAVVEVAIAEEDTLPEVVGDKPF
jgi:hypothetical protein